jgi:hypothetical protein
MAVCVWLEAAAARRNAPAEMVAAAKGSQERRRRSIDCAGNLVAGFISGHEDFRWESLKHSWS